MSRFAIYFAPPAESPLTRAASTWLDNDSEITSSPRVYGFHATLKPPFRLVCDRREDEFREALALFAACRVPFKAPPLRLGTISSFLALTLSEPCPEFVDLASACVREFDRFRQPPTEEEVARRRHSKLTPVQLDHLERWGYPYVMEEWRFHMTLTSSLDHDTLGVAKTQLANLFTPLCGQPIGVDSICLFEQPSEGERFRVAERFPFK